MTVLRTPSDGSPVSTDLRKLAQRLIDTGGQTVGIRFGTSSMAWAASTDSGPTTITHGLGRTPVFAAAFNADTVGSYPGIAAYTTLAVGATTFDVYGRTAGAITGTKAIYWLVIG